MRPSFEQVCSIMQVMTQSGELKVVGINKDGRPMYAATDAFKNLNDSAQDQHGVDRTPDDNLRPTD